MFIANAVRQGVNVFHRARQYGWFFPVVLIPHYKRNFPCAFDECVIHACHMTVF